MKESLFCSLDIVLTERKRFVIYAESGATVTVNIKKEPFVDIFVMFAIAAR